MGYVLPMNQHLTPAILTTTRPLTNEDRLALWRQKRERAHRLSPRSRPDHAAGADHCGQLVRARSTLPLL